MARICASRGWGFTSASKRNQESITILYNKANYIVNQNEYQSNDRFDLLTINKLACHSVNWLIAIVKFENSPDSGAMRFAYNELKTLADVAVALGMRYFAVCTVLIHPYSGDVPRQVFSLFKLLSLASDHQICVTAKQFSGYSEFLVRSDQIKCPRTMNIVFGEEELVKTQFTKVGDFFKYLGAQNDLGV